MTPRFLRQPFSTWSLTKLRDYLISQGELEPAERLYLICDNYGSHQIWLEIVALAADLLAWTQTLVWNEQTHTQQPLANTLIPQSDEKIEASCQYPDLELRLRKCGTFENGTTMSMCG